MVVVVVMRAPTHRCVPACGVGGAWCAVGVGCGVRLWQLIVSTVGQISRNDTALQQLEGLLDGECDTLFAKSPLDDGVCKDLAAALIKVRGRLPWRDPPGLESSVVEEPWCAGCPSPFPPPHPRPLSVQALPWLQKEIDTVAWTPEAFCATVIPVCQMPCCDTPSTPEQVHLAFTGSDMSSMTVTWTTLNPTATSTVQWGPAAAVPPALPNSATGTNRSACAPALTLTMRRGVRVCSAPTTCHDVGLGTWQRAATSVTLRGLVWRCPCL